ncbi:MAG: OsmC family protein [Sphaerochaeta sp.]
MSDNHTYITTLEWTKARKGALSSHGLPTMEVATPPNFPGGHPGIWSPEHLFIGAAEVCLMTTFLAIAEKSRFEFLAYSSQAEGTLGTLDRGMFVEKIVIRPRLVIREEKDREKGILLLEKAKKHCLISKSMVSEVTMEPEIVLG